MSFLGMQMHDTECLMLPISFACSPVYIPYFTRGTTVHVPCSQLSSSGGGGGQGKLPPPPPPPPKYFEENCRNKIIVAPRVCDFQLFPGRLVENCIIMQGGRKMI